MKYTETDDAVYVTHCVTHPSVWRMASDDGLKFVNPKLLFLKRGTELWLKTPHGVLIGKPANFITLDCHIALLPEANGIAEEICRGAIDWVFNNKRYARLTASIPKYNHLAIGLAKRSGMTQFGTNERSFMKNGRFYDQLLFGISRG